MYGLVNQAIEELVCSKYGDEAWEEVKRKANTDVGDFVRMESYPDSITYGIVGAACEHLAIAPETLLEHIGIYWVNFTGAKGYAEFLEAAGSDLFETLTNLDDMHTRVAMVYPKLAPPSFQCERISDDEIILHYRSHRDGLAHMVIGLVKGLAGHFGTDVEISRLLKKEDGATHDTFAIKITSQANGI
ncbi:MAG: heme NO-binding domain-containing protein, partial [Burkholderiaceae bacterium]